MSNYIKSEVYRILRYKWTYLFVIICSGLLLSMNIVLAAVKSHDAAFPYATTGFSFSYLYFNMSTLLLLTIAIGCMVFSNELNNHTIKNTISFGISRGTVYFSKFIMEILYAVIALLLITAIQVGSGYLLLEDSGIKELEIVLNTFVASFPLLISGLAVINFLLFTIESTGGAVAAAIGILLGLPTICNLLGMKFAFFKMAASILPYNILSEINKNEAGNLVMYWDTAKGMLNCWIIGGIMTILMLGIGYAIFKKMEIK